MAIVDQTNRVPQRRTITSSLVAPVSKEGEDPKQVPSCSHGPALRFSRDNSKSGESREFYACSVTRDRKVCGLFHWVDEWDRKQRNADMGVAKSSGAEPARKKLKNVPDCVFATNVDNKTNAQFVFDRASIKIVQDIAGEFINKTTNTKRILCLGTPTIHRALLAASMDSTLLDEDSRLVDMFPNTFRFNMFNGSWFNLDTNPIGDDFSLIICDPPFHPELLSAMKNTLSTIFPRTYEQGGMIMAFPYFFSKTMAEVLPGLAVSDIRLTYANHPKYKTPERSPVRVYMTRGVSGTLGEGIDFAGHEFCKSCDVHVSRLNSHCEKCQKCTTLAGKTPFIHCDICEVCVKPNSAHCFKCNRCFQGAHSC